VLYGISVPPYVTGLLLKNTTNIPLPRFERTLTDMAVKIQQSQNDGTSDNYWRKNIFKYKI